MNKKIKLFDPSVGTEEFSSITKVLKSHFWASGSGVGNVLKFEEKFKKYVDSDSCIAVNSGSSALNLALSLTNIKNKEVILPSLSFVSTAHAILVNGGIPVFVDVDPLTMCIDPNKIKRSISKKTKIVLPVHFAGMPSNLQEIIKICKENNLILIEDAAHAAGTIYKNKHIGKHGMACCFSFHPVKNLAMPTGGLISLNHPNYKKFETLLKSRRWCGITNRNEAFYDVKEMGWNYYMNEFSAAIGLVQLKKLNSMNKIRRMIASKYVKEIILENRMPYSKDCSYHMYWVFSKNRNKFRKKMREAGIETGIHYRPIHTMSMYKKQVNLPITEKAGKQIVSLPIHPNLSESEIEKIIKYTNKFAE